MSYVGGCCRSIGEALRLLLLDSEIKRPYRGLRAGFGKVFTKDLLVAGN